MLVVNYIEVTNDQLDEFKNLSPDERETQITEWLEVTFDDSDGSGGYVGDTDKSWIALSANADNIPNGTALANALQGIDLIDPDLVVAGVNSSQVHYLQQELKKVDFQTAAEGALVLGEEEFDLSADVDYYVSNLRRMDGIYDAAAARNNALILAYA